MKIINAISVDKINRISDNLCIRTKPNGLTVREMITELKKYSPDEKVYMYDENGDIYNIVRIMKDKRKLVIF